MEQQVLAAIVKDRDSFEKIQGHVESSDFSDQGQVVYDMAKDYYAADNECTFIDLDLLRKRVERIYPKNSEILLRVIDNLEDTSSVNVQKEFLHLKKQRLQQDLGHAFQAGDDNTINNLLSEYEQYNQDLVEIDDVGSDSVYIGEPIETLLESVSPDNLITMYPKVLNDRLGGGAPRGSHVLVYARPESGKTAFAINMACGFAKHDNTVLYIGNEEPYNMMLLRIISRLSGMTREQVVERPDDAMGIAYSRGYENIIFVSLSPGSIETIERLTNKYNPDIVLIDQLHNLSSRNQNKVERLEEQAKAVRDLGNRSGALIVSLTQAAESADGKVVLDQGDVYYSNTGIPGHADVMLGIGFDENMDKMGRRVVSISKNKINGEHAPISVHLDKYLSKITSL